MIDKKNEQFDIDDDGVKFIDDGTARSDNEYCDDDESKYKS